MRNPVTQVAYIPGSEPALFLGRGYTGHEHLPWFGLINMNARLYDAALGRFLAPDPYIQNPLMTQNYNRYTYAMNNPLVYIDRDGEAWWLVPVIVAAVFAIGNTIAHAIRGDIHNFWDGLKYFAQGAVVGFGLGAAWQFAPLIPYIGKGVQTVMTWYAFGQAGVGVLGMIGGAINDGWDGLGRASELFLGNFYLNEKEPWAGMWQGFTRHTWEMLQSFVGHTVSQTLNTIGVTNKVEYWGGVTFGTTQDKRTAVSIGNYVNVRTQPYNDFDTYILTDQTAMHEYGHTFDSRIWGPLYLPVIGTLSLHSADKANKTGNSAYHREKWYERSASRKAKKYFSKKFGVVWNEQRNPTY